MMQIIVIIYGFLKIHIFSLKIFKYIFEAVYMWYTLKATKFPKA